MKVIQTCGIRYGTAYPEAMPCFSVEKRNDPCIEIINPSFRDMHLQEAIPINVPSELIFIGVKANCKD